MDEHEQSGLLRTVVVIGTIAMIAMIIILSVVKLKSMTNHHVDNITQPTVSTSLLSPDDFTIKSHDEPGNYSTNVSKSVYSWDHSSTALHLNTHGLPNKTWVIAETKRFEIPNGAKRMKVSVTAKGTGSLHSTVWVHLYDANGRDSNSDAFKAVDPSSSKDVFETHTRIVSLKDTAHEFTINLESRENMIVDYKDVSVTFYHD